MNKLSKIFSLLFVACFLELIFSSTLAFTIPVFPVHESPYAGLADSVINSYNQGIQSRLLKEQLRTQQLQNQMLEQEVTQKRFAQSQRRAEKPVKIMLFSQNQYRTYLGCFNCPYYADDSIHNDGNSFGSQNGKKSIYNIRSVYGSTSSNLSPCNSQASHPPIIINNRGVVYGLLTLNTQLRGAIKEPLVLKWLKTKVCKK